MSNPFPQRHGHLSRMLPFATYRLQLHAKFTFHDAAAQADYLRNLGISHVYCSPYLQAVKGSTHGYDVVDHSRVNGELGGEQAHYEFCMALGRNFLGQILDIVPNHMAIGVRENKWWWDVLENGPSSAYAAFFDVEWDPPESRLQNVVLMPVLGDHYGRVLEAGEIKLRYQDGTFTVHYYDHVLPVSPESVATVVRAAANHAGSDDLAFLADLLSELPVPTETDEVRVARRHRDKEVLRRGLKRLYDRDEVVRAGVDFAVDEVNASPDLLDGILDRQNYRLAHWRTAGRNLGYRRFFDVNTLAALRMENRRVFTATHELILRWLREGVIDGVRVDHPDGLLDPAAYFKRLRSGSPHAWIVVEKILEPGERLRDSWEIAGTTGYDFAFLLNNLLVNDEAKQQMTELYTQFTGEPADFDEVARSAKHLVMRTSLASDVNRLTTLFEQICESHRRQRDHTRYDINHALRGIIASFSVYRTYVQPADNTITADDVRYITEAIDRARELSPDLPADLFDFFSEVLQLRVRGKLENEFVARFQQFTGPAMAKGVEDTAFYQYNRLTTLNEVGGDPGTFGLSVDDFHSWCEYMQDHWPEGMVTTSTHDTKRSEDVRARIAALSEIPEQWGEAVQRWTRRHEKYRRDGMPDKNTEYLLYQTLAGTHPIEMERLQAYLLKAVREAKRQTSWTDQNAAYEQAVSDFTNAVYSDSEFRANLDRFLEPVQKAGYVNALSQTLLKLTAPGVPDIYQGTEIWDYSLVDPDNRRPVDYGRRRELLSRLENCTPEQVMEGIHDGLPKLWVVRQALRLRCSRRDLFGPDGQYAPVAVTGERGRHIVAFSRGAHAVTVVPRLTILAGSDWKNTAIKLPRASWQNHLTGEVLSGGELPLSALLQRFPVALLSRE